MERTLPRMRLEWTVSDEHHLIPLLQRDVWLVQATKNGEFPLVCSRDESNPATIFGLEIPANLGPGGQPLCDTHARLPLEASVLAAVSDLLEAVAEGVRAHWGHATPFAAGMDIAEQTIHPHLPRNPPRGLPALKPPAAILLI